MVEIHQKKCDTTIWKHSSHSILEKRQITIWQNVLKHIHLIHIFHLEQGGAVRSFGWALEWRMHVPSKGDVPSGKVLLVILRYRVVFIKTIVNEVKRKLTHIYFYTSSMPAQLITNMYWFELYIFILCWRLMWRYSIVNRTLSTL